MPDAHDAGGLERRMTLHCFLRTFPARSYRDSSMTVMAERLAFELVLTRAQEGLETAQDSHFYGLHLSRSSLASHKDQACQVPTHSLKAVSCVEVGPA